MMGLPARLEIYHLAGRCAIKTFCGGISMPRSPRATITPSVTSRIYRKNARAAFLYTGCIVPSIARYTRAETHQQLT
jgi:hypothetical protein